MQPTLVAELNGIGLLSLFSAGTSWLERNAPLVNSLNVFPVPDGDTGTNMLLTMQEALREANAHPSAHAGAVSFSLYRGALQGARGNSGVYLSQILRGIWQSVEPCETVDAKQLAAGLREGARAAYESAVNPVEGTILTVIRVAAEHAARAAAELGNITDVIEHTHAGAAAAVARTPEQLPVLKEAGVVDAGGQGLAFIFEGASRYLNGESLESHLPQVSASNLNELATEDGYGYDIQFHIRGTNLNVPEIRRTIASLGDSALIVGDESFVKVHVHAPNPGEIVKYGAEQGALVNIIIENMQAQYLDFMAGNTADVRVGAENLGAILPHQAPPASVSIEDATGIATIAVVPGEGLGDIFESLRVSALVRGGPTMNPSAQDLLHAINQVAAQEVILLPNDKNIVPVANQVQQLTNKVIQVIPSRSIPQGLAALLAFNFQGNLVSNVQSMSAAMSRVRTIELTHAVRSARINEIQVEEGKPIALLDGELIASGEHLNSLLVHGLEQAGAAESEIVTLYYGSEITAAAAQEAYSLVQHTFPAQEIELHAGGQPLYPYIISIE